MGDILLQQGKEQKPYTVNIEKNQKGMFGDKLNFAMMIIKRFTSLIQDLVHYNIQFPIS
jgi:hypothetical protein